MRKLKNKGFRIICICLTTMIFSSCNIGGLDLQQSAQYNYSPVTLKLNMTAYKFIESRKNNDMSMLYEAINRVGYRDSFEVQNRTYIVMNDVGFTSYISNTRYAGIKYMSNATIIKLLNQYIVLGKYYSLSLTTNATQLQTDDPGTKISLSLFSTTIDVANKYQVLANFVGSTKVVSVVTCNLQPTNGIIHVIESYL